MILFPALALAAPYQCIMAEHAKFLDGRFQDWTEPVISLEASNWRPEAGVQPVYGGVYDLSASARFAWDAKRLYAAISVVDDIFVKGGDGAPESGDCIVLRVGPSVPAQDAPATIDLVIAFSDTGTVWQRDADGNYTALEGARVGIARDILPLPAKAIPREDGKGAATNITKIWYELSIPWTSLACVTAAQGDTFGLELQVLDIDGQALRGRLKWRGIPGEPRTRSDLGAVVFAPKATLPPKQAD